MQIAGSKFTQNTDGTVTIQPGRYLVKFNGVFNLGAAASGAAGGAVYLASARDLYFHTNIGISVPVSAYFKSHLSNYPSANAFSNQGAIVTIPYATTIRCDAQIVGQYRPWGWTTGWLTISGMEIIEQ